MRTGLIVLGVIFLAIGVLLYLVPVQGIKADTTTGDAGTVTSSATVTVPVGWAYTFAGIGFVLLMLGLMISGPTRVVQGPRGPRGRTAKRKRSKRPVRRTRTYRKATLPRGTSVTTTTRIRR